MTFEQAFFSAFRRAGFDAHEFSRSLREGDGTIDKRIVPYEAVTTERIDAILWECLVSMFGEWELSPRTGVVTDTDSAATWVELWAERAGNG